MKKLILLALACSSAVGAQALLGTRGSIQDSQFCRMYGCIVVSARTRPSIMSPEYNITTYQIRFRQTDAAMELERSTEEGYIYTALITMPAKPLRSRDYPFIQIFLKSFMGGEYSNARIDRCLFEANNRWYSGGDVDVSPEAS